MIYSLTREMIKDVENSFGKEMAEQLLWAGQERIFAYSDGKLPEEVAYRAVYLMYLADAIQRWPTTLKFWLHRSHIDLGGRAPIEILSSPNWDPSSTDARRVRTLADADRRESLSA